MRLSPRRALTQMDPLALACRGLTPASVPRGKARLGRRPDPQLERRGSDGEEETGEEGGEAGHVPPRLGGQGHQLVGDIPGCWTNTSYLGRQ